MSFFAPTTAGSLPEMIAADLADDDLVSDAASSVQEGTSDIANADDTDNADDIVTDDDLARGVHSSRPHDSIYSVQGSCPPPISTSTAGVAKPPVVFSVNETCGPTASAIATPVAACHSATSARRGNERTLGASSDVKVTSQPNTGETTFMLRNFPKKCTQREFLASIDAAGFHGCFDFFYLPIGSADTSMNRGYGFINFPDAKRAAEFYVQFHGCHLPRYKRKKPLELLPADVQGYDANYEHFLGTRVTDRASNDQPLFLRHDPAPPTRKKKVVSTVIPDDRQELPKSQLPDVIFCVFCGSVARPEFRFCMICGKPIQSIPPRV
jgi:hypothetical protein